MSASTGDAPHHASSPLSPEKAIELFSSRLPTPCRLLIAFSGGGDSTGLLSLLCDARLHRPDIELHAATVDHGLRAGSAEEALAAASVCDTLSVPHAILRWSGEKPSTGIQAAARAARYALLAAEAERIDATMIVTGHTWDDQRETLAMRRARDPEASSGMDEAVLVEGRAWVARPLLAVSREDIRLVLESRGLSWSEDPSNRNLAFERVRVRQAGAFSELPVPRFDRTPVQAAAGLARHALQVHPGPVAEIAIGSLASEPAASRMLLSALIAILGGQVHGPHRSATDRIFTRLVAGADFRFAVGRVILDRRRDRLFLCREERGLPEVAIAAGEAVVWDARFRIENAGTRAVRIAAGSGLLREGHPLVTLPGERVPKGVARRAAITMPRLVEGDPSTLVIGPVLAPYEQFLPSGRLELAQAMAEAFGRERFPRSPLGDHAF